MTKRMMMMLALLTIVYSSFAATYFSRATGSWNTNTTWSLSSGGPAVGAGIFPVAGDVVTIEGGFNVTVTANAACASITFTNVTATSLTINNGITLSVSGAITIPRSGAGLNTIAVGAGNLNAGSVAFTNGGAAVRHSITISTGTVIVSGNVAGSAGNTSGTISFSGSGVLRLGGSIFTSADGTLTTFAGSTVEYNAAGAQTVGNFTYSNLTLSGSGAKTTTGATVNGILSLEGTATTAGTVSTYGGASTLQYKGSVAQITGIEFTTPWPGSGGVKIENANGVTINAVKSLGANPLTIGSVIPASVFNDGGFQLTATGVLNLTSGTFRLGSAGTGTTWPAFTTNNITAGTTVEYASGVAQSVSSTPAYQNLTFTGLGTKTLLGNITPAGNLTLIGSTFNLGTFTANRSAAGGTLNLDATSTLLIGGTNTFPSNYTTNTLSAGSVVNYSGTNQNVSVKSYSNLSLSGSGTKTLLGNITPGGNLTVTGSTFDLGSFTADRSSAGGTLSLDATSSLLIGSTNSFPANYATNTLTAGSTVNYYGTNQNVAANTYSNLIISGGNIKTLIGSALVNGTLTLTSGVFQLSSFDLTFANSIAGAPFGLTKMIETNGAGRLIRSGNVANESFNMTFPVGSGGYYSPLIISGLPVGGAAARSLSVRAVPANAGVLSNTINKYWDLSATNITNAVTNAFSFQYNAGEIVGDPLLFLPYTNTSGSWAVATGPSLPGSNPAVSTGSPSITGFWTVGSSTTYYSYQTGLWDQSSTWTSDPGGTTGPGSTIPGGNDKVVILSGRTVSLQADNNTQNLDITINNGGILDQSTFRFTGALAALRGDGTLKLSSSNFPSATINTFVSTDGGNTEYNQTGTMSGTQLNYYHLTIRTAGTVTLTNDITLVGNLNIKQGVFQINDNNARRLHIVIGGSVTVDNTGSIAVGTGGTNSQVSPLAITGATSGFLNYYELQSHRIQIAGDFTNNGTVKFSNLTFPVYNQLASNGFATVYFQGLSDNSLNCNGTTDFYNLVVDKGSDQTFKLTIHSSAYNNFRLFGANTADGSNSLPVTPNGNPNLKKALWIKNGSLVLQGLVAIPSLSEGNTAGAYPSDFFIPVNGALVVDGAGVIVLSTADDFTEVNAAYGLAGGSNAAYGINTTGGYSGLANLGKLQVNNGYLSTRESSGLQYYSYASGHFIINGGTVDTKQFHNPEGGALGLVSYTQNGGNLIIRGRLANTINYVTPTDLSNPLLKTARAGNGIDSNIGIGSFSLNSNAANGFSMSGGTMSVYDVCNVTATPLAFLVNSPVSNINITGGTVQILPTTGTVLADADYFINTTGPIQNFSINRGVGSASVVRLVSNPLVVLKDLTITSGAFDAMNLDVTVGGNFTIAATTSYTSGTNNTIFNGSGAQTFSVFATQPLNKLTINKPAGTTLTFGGTASSIINVADNFSLIAGTLSDNGNTINVSKNVFNSGIYSGAGKLVLNGTLVQTIDGNGFFSNVDLNNTNAAAAPVSLVANMTVNGILNLVSNKIFNISTNNLTITGTGSITSGGYSNTRYVHTNGQAGDGGITKIYTSTVPFLFPLGSFSTNRVATYGYTPATVGFSSAPTTYGSLTVVPVGYEHPSTTVNNNSLTYFWSLSSTGFTGIVPGSVTHTFVYSPTDVNGAIGNYVPSLYNRTAFNWNSGLHNSPPINTVTSTITDWFAPANSTNFLDADYTAGDNTTGGGAFGGVKVYYSLASGLWGNNATWTFNASHTGAQAGSVPGLNDAVVIGNNHLVRLTNNTYGLNSATVKCASLQIDAGSTLDIENNPGSVFSIVVNSPLGNGTFRITTSVAVTGAPNYDVSPFVWPLSLGDFTAFEVNKGTEEFYTTSNDGNALYILPPKGTFGNLKLSPFGGDNMAFPNYSSVTVYGDLTLNGTTGNSATGVSWNTNNTYYNFTNFYPTVEKTLTVNGNMNVNGGSLLFWDDIAPQHLVINGDVNVAATNGACILAWDKSYGATPYNNGPTVNNTFAIGGNLNNNGAVAGLFSGLNLVTTNAPVHYVDLSFFGPANSVFTGTGPNDLHNVTVNKGASQSTTLTLNSTGTLTTPLDNWLTLQNGTFIYNRTGNFNISANSPFTIPASSALTINTTSSVYIANAAVSTNDLYLNGKITLLTGNVNVGPNPSTASSNDIEYSSGGASAIDVQGGNLIVNGQIRRNPSNAAGVLSYSQSGGNVTINGQASNATNAKLEVLNSGSNFTMSNGTLTIVHGNDALVTPASPFGDLYLRPSTGSVTGGTIIFAPGASSQNYFLDATIPLNHLTIAGTAPSPAIVRLLVSPLTLNGNMLINANSILNSNNIDIIFNGNFTNTPGAGGYVPVTNLTTFSATDASTYL